MQNPPYFYIWLEIWCHICAKSTSFLHLVGNLVPHSCKIHLISTSGWKSGAIFVQNPPHFYIWLEIWCHIRIQHTQFHIRRRILVIAINRAFLLNFFCACTELVYIQSEDRFGFSARDFLSEDEILLLYPDKQGHYC